MKVIYSAVFLDRPLPGRLTTVIANQHVTHVFRPSTVDKSFLGKKVAVKLLGYANDGVNEGYSVSVSSADENLHEALKSILVPHITLSVSESGKPVDTQKLDFKPVDKCETIIGSYGVFCDDGRVHFEL